MGRGRGRFGRCYEKTIRCCTVFANVKTMMFGGVFVSIKMMAVKSERNVKSIT